ncbi:MAG: NADH-quinone oxidoreductase subunit NuoN [Alphaproteobacteria bacterium]
MMDSMMLAAPEIVMAVGAMALLMVGAFGAPGQVARLVDWGALAVLLATAIMVIANGAGPATAFGGAIIIDQFAVMMKIMVLVGAGLAIVLASEYMRHQNIAMFEFPVLVLLATLGMLMMISAGDLIALYLGLELQALALYVLAGLRRDSLRSTEAALKYFVLGALSSGMLLYGASLIYGFAGIAAQISTGSPSLGVVFGLVFLIAGLAFKVSAVPFHMWTPDVYEGSPTPVTAMFAIAPKIAAMALFLRILVQGFGDMTQEWQQIIVFISIASMVLGAFAAIGQRNIKRLLAYSSIGHMGFALVGLAAGTEVGVAGTITYLAIYMAMVAGTFAAVLLMRRGGTYVEDISDLAGLSRTHPVMAFFLATMMFSLAGIPPLAGFFAKFYVFLAAVQAGLWALAVIGVLASVVGAFYYLRIVKIIYFDDPVEAFEPATPALSAILVVSGLAIIGFIFYPAPLVSAAAAAARALF